MVLEGWTAETLVVGRHTRPAGGVETWGVNTWASDDTGGSFSSMKSGRIGLVLNDLVDNA
jgi:hypothetical protein